MAQNPLFPQSDPKDTPDTTPVVLPQREKVIQPLSNVEELRASFEANLDGRDAAANVIRQKLEAIYADEPSAEAELTEVKHNHATPSKHQQYLTELQKNATSVAEIQIKWHEYYAQLPEEEKHEVWQEFYAEQSKHSRYAQFLSSETARKAVDPDAERHTDPPKREVVAATEIATASASRKRITDARSSREIKASLKNTASANGKLGPKHHLQSLFFGLSMGAAVLLVMLFSLFNEMVIAPFIQPSRTVSATPIILDGSTTVAGDEPKVIIPKINVEIPVDYSLTSLEEDVVQQGLEQGVVHYPVTSKPGEEGNAAFFGHSSNNIFNPGKYKFAFVLLNKLEDGDMFYLIYEEKVYAYRVFKKEIVAPTDTWVLGAFEGKKATATLITCDPPGTTLNRLVVWGEQISPEPIDAAPSSATLNGTEAEAKPLPGPPESLWRRIFNIN